MNNLKIHYLFVLFQVIPFLIIAQQRTITQIDENENATTEVSMNYKSWNNIEQWIKINDNNFALIPSCTFEGTVENNTLNYTTWNGEGWSTRLDGNTWVIAPNGDFDKSFEATALNYLDPNGDTFIATFKPFNEYSNDQKMFTHVANNGDFVESNLINYRSWNGDSRWARINANTFTEADNPNFVNSTQDDTIYYLGWDGSKWAVKVIDNTWYHAPNGDFSRVHQSNTLDYVTPDDNQWTATFNTYQEFVDANTDDNSPLLDTVNVGVFIVISPVIIAPGGLVWPSTPVYVAPVLQIGSLADVYPNESSPFLTEDLGLFDHLVVADGNVSSTWPISRMVGDLAHEALNEYIQNIDNYKSVLPAPLNTQVNAANIRDKIRDHVEVRSAVNGLLFTRILDKMVNASDQSAGAIGLRNWMSEIYKNQNIAIQENTLNEYYSWKINPCAYSGDCPPGLLALLSAPKPPMDLITRNGMANSLQSATGFAGALTFAGATITTGIAAGVLVAQLAPANVSLFATFLGASSSAITGVGGLGIAATVTGPAAIVVAAVAIGVVEAINLNAALSAERKLVERLDNAQNEVVNINNFSTSDEKVSILFQAFINLSVTPAS